MPEIALRLDGADAVLKRLQSLGAVGREKAMVVAMKKAMRPVVISAQNMAPRRSGALRMSIAAIAVKSSKIRKRQVSSFGFFRSFSAGAKTGESTFAFVTVAPVLRHRRAIALYNLDYGRGKRGRIKGIYYGHFLEFGTKKGIGPQRFLERALQMNSQRVLDVFGVEIGRAIDRQLRIK